MAAVDAAASGASASEESEWDGSASEDSDRGAPSTASRLTSSRRGAADVNGRGNRDREEEVAGWRPGGARKRRAPQAAARAGASRRLKPPSEELERFGQSVVRGVCPVILATEEAEALAPKARDRLLRYLNDTCNQIAEDIAESRVPPPPVPFSFQFSSLSSRIKVVRSKAAKNAQLLDKIEQETLNAAQELDEMADEEAALQQEIARLEHEALQPDRRQPLARGALNIPEHLLPPDMRPAKALSHTSHTRNVRRRAMLESLESLRILT